MIYVSRLKATRERLGISQTELAKKLNIDRTSYWHYENEDNIIPLKHLLIILNIFNVSLDYIFGLTIAPQYKETNIETDLIKTSSRLKEFRKENHLTQNKLAEKLNIDSSLISKYESGKYLISTSSLYDLCKNYNISADYLISKTDYPKYLK